MDDFITDGYSIGVYQLGVGEVSKAVVTDYQVATGNPNILSGHFSPSGHSFG